MQKYTKMQHLADGGISGLELVMLSGGRNAVLRHLLPLHLFNIKNFLRFRHGTQVRAKLSNHPNIVASYECGFDGFIPAELIEYIPGNNLKVLYNQHSALFRENIYEILLSAATGLAFVHSNGLQHLDVKPENFMLRTGHELIVKLTDFDLTRDASDRGPRKQQGTPAYMAPEQLRRHCSSQASDVFAFCVMAYTFLGGHHPFMGSSVKSTIKHQASGHLNARPLDELNPNVPDDWTSAIMNGLAKHPEERIPDMQSWLKRLQNK